jgi:hypothetical protein
MLASSTLSPDPQLADLDQAPAWRSLFPAGRGGLVAFFVVACLVGLGFSLYTQQIWEDALITLRFSENLLKGDGLVYNKGERVHGFTSPINVLLLALCHLLTGQTSYVATLWLYRVFTIPAFALGGVFALRAMIGTAPRWTPALGFVGLAYLLDGKVVAFSANGMETGFTLLALSAAIYLLSRSRGDDWLPRGLCWTGLMWSRPDGCVYIAALAAAELIYFSQENRSVTLRSLFKSAAVCAILYSPWLLWAWWYYGSPIPQTVIAKSNIEQGTWMQIASSLEKMPERTIAIAGRILRPVQMPDANTWAAPEGWARAAVILTKVISLFGLFYWLVPVRDGLGRAASLCFTLLCLYFSIHTLPYLWYFPPAAAFGYVAFCRGLTVFVAGTQSWPLWSTERRKAIAFAAMGLLTINQIGLFAAGTRAEGIWQKEVEFGNRAKIGEWLKAHGSAHETVFLEPLGYIGYFSGKRMIDFPGLVAPEVVRLRREKQVNLISAIKELQPDWVVLRLFEFRKLSESAPDREAFEKLYRVEAKFNVNEVLDQYGDYPDNSVVRFDAFYVVCRKSTPGAAPALPPPN